LGGSQVFLRLSDIHLCYEPFFTGKKVLHRVHYKNAGEKIKAGRNISRLCLNKEAVSKVMRQPPLFFHLLRRNSNIVPVKNNFVFESVSGKFY
jgi:hypothetical protein